MTRANKIVVVADGENYRATFKRTHKVLMDVHSESTDWKPSDKVSKILQRESFRQWIIDHADDYDIEYKPEDMRADGQVRVAQYTNDDILKSDVMALMINDIKNLTGGCSHVEWGGMDVDSITPKTKTGKGTDLSRLGIKDGKYKSGNWAWADIQCMATVKYDKDDVYVPFTVELVSGQLRKPKITKTKWAGMIKEEIVLAGLATAEQLDPPKEKKSRGTDKEDRAEESTVALLTEEEVRKIRKKDELVAYAHSIGIAVTDIKMKDLREKVIRHMESINLAKAE